MSNYNPESKLEVFNIGKKYKNRPVLRNVSLNVKRGEAVGLLGPNGAGKTTCFYCVTGLISPPRHRLSAARSFDFSLFDGGRQYQSHFGNCCRRRKPP